MSYLCEPESKEKKERKKKTIVYNTHTFVFIFQPTSTKLFVVD